MIESPAQPPTSDKERLSLLDALRGFALLGILFVNMTWFTGFAVSSAEERTRLGTEAADAVVYWLIHFAVDGKFWSLFALLFGVGFAIQSQRAQADGRRFAPVFLRRMAILLLIGLSHAIFIWFGDILGLYAVVGMTLPLFRRCTDRTLVRWALVCGVLVPILAGGIRLAANETMATTAGTAVDPGHGPHELLATFGTGGYAEVFAANWAFLKERWFLAVYTNRFFALLAMFLIGFLSGRMGFFQEPTRHLPFLRRFGLWCLLVGLPANVVLAILMSDVPIRPPSALGWLMASIQAVGVPALSLAYVAGLILIHLRPNGRWYLAVLANTGRMSLTNYIIQSVVGVTIFYGYGLGYWGSLGAAGSVPLILSIFAGQTILSAWWLRRFRYGPLEWLWRSLTYGSRLPVLPRQELTEIGSNVVSTRA